MVLTVYIATVAATEQVGQLRCKIIDKQGVVGIWSKSTTDMVPFEQCTSSVSGKTLLIREKASIHVTFEPLIDLFVGPSTTVGFDNMQIDHTVGAIRILMNLEKGTIHLKAPPQAGYTLLFTLQTPAAVIDLAAAEIDVAVGENGTVIAEVLHGSAKILPRESSLKTVLNKGSRGMVKRGEPQVQLSAIGDTARKTIEKYQKQPSIAILSIKSKDNTAENLEPISNSVATAFEKTTSAKVLFLDDVKKLLHAEGVDRLLDCFSDSCISRIGSQAGVDIVIVGNLGKLGSTHVLDLKMIDVLRDKMLKRTSISVVDDLGLLLNEIPGAIERLVESASVLTAVVENNFVSDSVAPVGEYKEKVVWVFPGKFEMGAHLASGEVDELPDHKVQLNGFFIDRFEVTREDFEQVMGFNPSSTKGCGNCPSNNITWQEAQNYCQKVGKRLPTEAEWEYACRAGTNTPFFSGVTITDEQANFDASKPYGGSPVGVFRGKVVPVGSFSPNGWNLHDMYGNVAEWCADWYDVAYYGNSPAANPKGPSTGKLKVVRGGSWNNEGKSLRSANRSAYNPELRLNTIGFRCVKDDGTQGGKTK